MQVIVLRQGRHARTNVGFQFLNLRDDWLKDICNSLPCRK